MADDPPRLRLVDPGETAAGSDETPLDVAEPAAAAPDDGGSWRSAALPVCLGLAVLVVALAVSIRLLFDGGGAGDDLDDAATPPAAAGPTNAPPTLPAAPDPTDTTAVPVTTTAVPSVVAPPVDGTTDWSLVPVPVPAVGAPGGVPATTPPPAVGTVRIRLFNGFLVGSPLEVWDVSGAGPARYGSVPYGGLAEIVAGGRLLPTGVDLRVRFTRPGGDPAATPDPSRGPWEWNFTPADGSSQTMVMVHNPGLRIVRIDNLRARSDTPPGRAHVVPVTRHLVLGGSRSLRWSVGDGVGCLGLSSDEPVEFDVAPLVPLRLSAETDASCAGAVAGPAVVPAPGPYAVVGLDDGAPARLVAVPLS